MGDAEASNTSIDRVSLAEATIGTAVSERLRKKRKRWIRPMIFNPGRPAGMLLLSMGENILSGPRIFCCQLFYQIFGILPFRITALRERTSFYPEDRQQEWKAPDIHFHQRTSEGG